LGGSSALVVGHVSLAPISIVSSIEAVVVRSVISMDVEQSSIRQKPFQSNKAPLPLPVQKEKGETMLVSQHRKTVILKN